MDSSISASIRDLRTGSTIPIFSFKHQQANDDALRIQAQLDFYLFQILFERVYQIIELGITNR